MRNIVIIGAANGGAVMARTLAKSLPDTHRIVLLDSSDSVYWNIAGLRGAVVPGFEEKVFMSLDNFFASGSRHIVKPSTTVTELHENHVVTEQGETIEFDYAVIATGATYSAPGRAKTLHKAESLEWLRTMQKDIAAATNILCVGAGPVAIEMAGEIVQQYGVGKKGLTIVGDTKQLVGDQFGASLHNKLSKQLAKAKVDVILQDMVNLPKGQETGPVEKQDFTTKNGKTISGVDYIIVSFFGKPRSDIVSSVDPAAVDERGFVKTDASSLRVQSQKLRNYFALGDVTNLPGGKTSIQVEPQANAAAANITALLKAAESQRDSVSMKPYKPMPLLIVVPFGTSGGASQLPFITLGEWTTSLIKGKTLFVSRFEALYKPA